MIWELRIGNSGWHHQERTASPSVVSARERLLGGFILPVLREVAKGRALNTLPLGKPTGEEGQLVVEIDRQGQRFEQFGKLVADEASRSAHHLLLSGTRQAHVNQLGSAC